MASKTRKNTTSNEYDASRELFKKLKLNENATEIVIALLLSFATITTAWSGYQASRWGGEQSTKYSEAGALRVESTRASTEAGQQTQIDIGLFTNWVNAYAENNEALSSFYEKRFRDEFKPAFNAWIATSPADNPESPKSPFEMPQYVIEKSIESSELEEQASETFNQGKAANQQSDDYILNTVFLASVLFLSGIASKIRLHSVRLGIVTLGLLMLAIGLLNIIRYPVI